MPTQTGKHRRRVKHREMEDTPEDRKDCDFSTTDNPDTASLSQADDTALTTTLRLGESVSQPHSYSLRSLSQIPCKEKGASFRAERSHSLNDILCYTPDIFVEGSKENYWLHCNQAGLFQCNVTGLVFNMKAEGDVIYRTVPWSQRLVAKLVKRPEGPLFDIKCPRGSFCQLHLPHCEIISAGGGQSLSVAHLMDEESELIVPHLITTFHVIINVTGCSEYGVVGDVNPDNPNPKRALVLMFYTPPIDDIEPISILKVLLLPGNVVRDEVINKRRETIGEEIHIERHACKLIPNQEYTLSTSPHDSITIEPNKTTFDVDESSYHNYIPTFNVTLKGKFKDVKLFLRESNISESAWECHVDFSAPDITKHQVQSTPTLTATGVSHRLFSVRRRFIDSVSLPVLNALVDKLLEERVLNDAEKEMANGKQVKHDKASFIIDTVRVKGPAASSSMISGLCEIDPFLSEHLGFTQQNGSEQEHPQPRRSPRRKLHRKGRPDGASKERTQPRMETKKSRLS